MIKEKPESGKFLTYFILYFPTIIILAMGITIDNQMIFTGIALLVAFLQLVVMKNFVDKYFA